MISYLKGKIKYQTSNWIILDVHGVGYKIYVSKCQSVKVSKKELKNSDTLTRDTIELFIYNHIREDRSELYGFKTMDELHFFELLIGVNGVGPKMGMNILSKADIEQIKKAILSNDITLLTAIGGVGKKIASKIIIELKNKLGSLEDVDLSNLDGESNEFVDAMSALGYKKTEIIPYLSKLPTDLKSTQEKVRWMLKQMK